MTSAWIRPRSHAPSRKNPKGSRTYIVLYRRGGRAYRVETAGTFKTERDARTRRDVVAGWLAQGLDPRIELQKIQVEQPKPLTLHQGIVAFNASRIDGSPRYRDVIKNALVKLDDELGTRLPGSIEVADLQLVVEGLGLAPSTTRVYVGHWRTLFDFLAIEPNPAKSKHLRLPTVIREEVNPPTADHFLAALAKIPTRYHLALITAEQTGMRIGEVEGLQWGDVDESGNRFRLRTAATKTRRARWVQVPEWLMPHITETCPIEDRTTERQVFQKFNARSARQALQTACAAAGVPHFSPHDLRHRRATIWHHSGLPVRVQMERGGWTRSEIPLEIYSHLMPLDEIQVEKLEAVLA